MKSYLQFKSFLADFACLPLCVLCERFFTQRPQREKHAKTAKAFAKYYKAIIISSLLIFYCLSAKAQLTNIGDTLSISKGSYIYIPGDMTLIDSSSKYPVIISNGTIKISGNLIKSPHSIYNGGTDSLILTGKDNQLFPGFHYYRFLADSGGNKYPDGNPEIRNAMQLKDKSIIVTGNDTIILDSAANLSEDNVDYILGNTRYSKFQLNGFYYQNGGIGLETVADSTNPDNTIIFRKTGPDAIQYGFCSEGIEKYFEVYPQKNASPGATIVFHYFPHELNGIKRKNLWLYQSPDSGKSWYRVDSIFNDTFSNTITCLPGKPFARYTLGDSMTPLVNAVKAGRSKTICLGESVQIGGIAVGNHVYSWASNPPGFSSSIANPKISLAKTTTYYLKEIVPNSNCVNTDSVTIIVNPGPNTSWKIIGACPEYTFQANDTTFKNYTWSFGDGSTGSGPVVSHSFSSDSVYKVSLVVSDSLGCIGQLDSSEYFNINNLDLKLYPNPFSSNINVRFNLCSASDVVISVSDINGQELGKIVNGKLEQGFHQYNIDFKTRHWRDAMYFVRLQINDKQLVTRVVRIQ